MEAVDKPRKAFYHSFSGFFRLRKNWGCGGGVLRRKRSHTPRKPLKKDCTRRTERRNSIAGGNTVSKPSPRDIRTTSKRLPPGGAFGYPRLTKTNICRGGVSPPVCSEFTLCSPYGTGLLPPTVVGMNFHTAGAYGMPPYGVRFSPSKRCIVTAAPCGKRSPAMFAQSKKAPLCKGSWRASA